MDNIAWGPFLEVHSFNIRSFTKTKVQTNLSHSRKIERYSQSVTTNREVVHLLLKEFGVRTPVGVIRTLRVHNFMRPITCKRVYAALNLTSIVNLLDVKSVQRFPLPN